MTDTAAEWQAIAEEFTALYLKCRHLAGQDAEARGYERGVKASAREAGHRARMYPRDEAYRAGCLACESAILALLPRTEGGGT